MKSMPLALNGTSCLFSLFRSSHCTYFSFSYDSNSGGEREIQRTMLELLNQLDGFDSRGDVKEADRSLRDFDYEKEHV